MTRAKLRKLVRLYAVKGALVLDRLTPQARAIVRARLAGRRYRGRDANDAAIARRRLAEIAADPTTLVSGAALDTALHTLTEEDRHAP